jgi:hypothetical protein
VLALAAAPSLVGTPAQAAASPYDPFFAPAATIADFALANGRVFGVATGDFDEDGNVDVVSGRVLGQVAFSKGNGSGGFAAPTTYAWKQASFNAAAFATADVNADGNLDVVWGASTASTGCSVSPIPSGGTCATAGGVTVNVADGDVRAFLGNGNGTFQETTYFVSGVRHNAGVVLSRVGSTVDVGSIATADVDADGDPDLVVGAVDGANSVVRLLTNTAGVFAASTIASQATACATPCSPIYFPASSTQNSPWGLAFGDADGDGDQDLWAGDRALYVYLYKNNGSGVFTMHTGNAGLPAGRSNAYIDHDTFRAAVGFTPSLASADVNGDGRADLFVGLDSGAQTPTTGCTINSVVQGCPHDGEVLLDVSAGTAHTTFGSLGDLGTVARGLQTADVNADGAVDLVAGVYEGMLKLMRQLPPIDSDADGISDYVDNAPAVKNAPRIDMNTDGSYNAADQLDNDFDTVRGDPEDSSTWQRLGDPADPDDDNDTVADGDDNCAFTANPAQDDGDGDGAGDACDPLFDTDADGDGVPAFDPDDPMYARAQAAAAKWAEGDTHFVIRIDALGRLFQNEFTGLMSDAAVSSPATWAAKCQGMYTAGTDPDPGCASLDGGREVPVSTVVIPRLLWTDPEVITWINDRNDNPLLEIGQHGTYHNSGPSNTQLGDWKDDPDKNFFSCDICGLSLAESYELMKVGQDTLLGNYTNRWLVDSGATGASPKIDWSTSANPLISFAPPFNTSDPTGREALAQLGYKSFSASTFEEGEPPTTFGSYFTPEGSHHEQFDQFGMFHASADVEFDPIGVGDGSYDQADRDAFADHLADETQPDELNTWLIEEVEWSGRPCNEADRLGTCNGSSNRENNTVYGPRWEQWLQLLDYVRDYPGGVAMTLGDVALAKAFDNAPTVANADQADSDADGVGDVVDGATLTGDSTQLTRNVAGTISAVLADGGTPLPGQQVAFAYDADGNGDTTGSGESQTATTGSDGRATVTVTATRPIGASSFAVSWDGGTATASGSGSAEVGDLSTVTLDSGNPSTGQVTDAVTLGATLADSNGAPVQGKTLTFSIGTASNTGVTDALGHASAVLTLVAPSGAATLQAAFAGGGGLGSSSATHAFTVAKEDTGIVLTTTTGAKSTKVVVATLSEADGAKLAGQTVSFETQDKVRSKMVVTQLGTAVTDSQGVARLTIASKYLSTTPRPVTARYAGNTSYLSTSATINVTR